MLRALILGIIITLAWPVFGQEKTIFINDSNGNQTIGTLDGAGNVFFHDSKGNISSGTIRDGNVFLTSTNGPITFGTIKNGNVFLTDQHGITTGTIRNGNIFLSNSDGSITTGVYNRFGSTTTTTSPPVATPSSIQQTRQEQFASSYQAGYAVGQILGMAINAGVQKHQIKSYCKKNPKLGFITFADGSIMSCPNVNAGMPVKQFLLPIEGKPLEASK
jgi:hypothetical protein